MNIIIVDDDGATDRLITDADALVIRDGALRVCRTGRPDEDIDSSLPVVVTP